MRACLIQLISKHLHAVRQSRKLRGLVSQDGYAAARVAGPQRRHKVEVGAGQLVRVKALRTVPNAPQPRPDSGLGSCPT